MMMRMMRRIMRVCMLEGGCPRALNCAWTAQSLGLASCGEL
jgi:hypothetical protein